jgi:cell shape-determining protein MreC
MRIPALTAGWVCLALTFGWAAQGKDGSLSDLDIEFTEAKVTLQTVTDENLQLKKQLAQSQETIKSLTESLAESNSEAEEFRRKCGELTLRMEALGIDASSETKLQQRLLKAVSDLRLVQTEKDKLSDQVIRLTEAMLRYMKTASSVDADARMSVETEMRNANEALGLPSSQAQEAQAVPATLTDAMIVSIKEEWALVVTNVGRKQGVKVGMPFKVIRGDSEVGVVRVVNVRDNISGAVIQSLDSEKNKIKVGDRLRVAAAQ